MSPAPDVIKLAIIGASGRMGLSLMRLLPEFPKLKLHAALASGGSAALGRDSGELAGVTPSGVPVSADLEAALKDAALVLDFSTETTSRYLVPMCAGAGAALLLGTTGLGSDMPALIGKAAGRIPLLVAPNTSVGAALLEELVRRAAATLGAGFAVRVHDRHHRDKRDSPSGTALALGAAILEARGPEGLLSYASVREADVVGEHEVEFQGAGEQLRLAHVATDRAIFARGALSAGLWLARQPPGKYRMADILNEK